MNFEEQIKKDLHQYLMSEKRVDEKLPECPDVEALWPSVEKAYLPDAVREFPEYPVVSLGWIMFVGMAFAKYWDVDWEKYANVSGEQLYVDLRDVKGYDNLDDVVLYEVLGLDKEEGEKVSEIVGECAARTLSAIQHSSIEPGTEKAVEAYRGALHALYIMGMAMELNALGYHMQLLG
ncbi:MAG: hypothetical protein K2J78_14595 [Muribaculaceae bacterium]|nr:hypothetical protein [Muribaculaceae bacterium]